jgi:hypothetical protein
MAPGSTAWMQSGVKLSRVKGACRLGSRKSVVVCGQSP